MKPAPFVATALHGQGAHDEDSSLPASLSGRSPDSSNASKLEGTLIPMYTYDRMLASTRSVKPESAGIVWHIVEHLAFKIFIYFTIFATTVQMGLAADLTSPGWEDAWKVFDMVVCCIFLLEMLLKLIAFRKGYFRDYWHCLDFFIVWVSVFDVFVIPLSAPNWTSDTQILKTIRLLRLLRMVKLFRIIPELMMVIEGMVASLKSMFWVFLLLAVMMYAWGIYCVHVIGDPDAGYPGFNDDSDFISETIVEDFNSYVHFGTLSRAMVSLFGIVLLSEWSQIVRPTWEVQPAVVLVFLLLVVFATFGVLNIIIGVVVERTTASMNRVRARDIEKLREEQMSHVHTISDLMFHLDTNNDQRISRQEMELGCTNERLHELLSKIDLPHGFTFSDFHQMLDLDGSGLLSKDEFVNGMLRLIYCDQFQRDCLFQLSIGQIKRQNYKLAQQLRDEVHASVRTVLDEVAALRRELLGTSSSVTQDGNVVAAQLDEEGISDELSLPVHQPMSMSLAKGRTFRQRQHSGDDAAAVNKGYRPWPSGEKGGHDSQCHGTVADIDEFEDDVEEAGRNARRRHGQAGLAHRSWQPTRSVCAQSAQHRGSDTLPACQAHSEHGGGRDFPTGPALGAGAGARSAAPGLCEEADRTAEI